MNFLTKFEDFINNLIIRFCERFVELCKRLTPKICFVWYAKAQAGRLYLIKNFKQLPTILQVWAIDKFAKIKIKLKTTDYKGKSAAALNEVQIQYRSQSSKGVKKSKVIINTPIIYIKKWVQDRSAAQSMLLLGLTSISLFAGIQIISTGQKMISITDASRSPASMDDLTQYDRPEYYKMESRHVMVSNIRLPVYFAEVNDLRTVDIDFNATLSNRQSKMFLEKYEFQLRDFLIIQVEPLIASFTIEAEGREMLKKKIWLEINNFLKERHIEGHVEEVQVTYVLAN